MKAGPIFLVMLLLLAGLALTQPRAGATTNTNPTQTLWLYNTDADSADAFISSQTPNTNYGGAALLDLGSSGTGGGDVCNFLNQCWILVKPNLALIPSNIIIQQAVFYLWMEQTVNASGLPLYVINRVTSSWSEGTVTFNTAPSILGGQAVGLLGLRPSLDIFTWVAVDVTNMTRSWLNGTNTNFGFEIQYNGGAGEYRFPSKEQTQGLDERPKMMVVYQPKTATIYTAFVCSGGPCETQVLSGSGLPPYLFNVTMSENNGTTRIVPRPDIINANISEFVTLNVSDFFGNRLASSSKVVTSNPFIWRIFIPYGIFETVSQRDFFTRLRITPQGGTAMNIDIPPRAWWVIPLKTGVSYTFNWTFLNSFFAATAYVQITTTMPSQLDYIVNGTSIQQIAQTQQGTWSVVNDTKAVSAIAATAALAPKGLDLFKSLWNAPTLRIVVPIGVNLWTIILVATVAGWLWLVSPAGFPRTLSSIPARNWPKRLQAAVSVLVVLSFFLFLMALLYVQGGPFVIPFPVGNA